MPATFTSSGTISTVRKNFEKELQKGAVASVAAATGTATRTTFATGSVTTAQLAERVMALLEDLKTRGVIS
jgi:hypothetical protein